MLLLPSLSLPFPPSHCLFNHDEYMWCILLVCRIAHYALWVCAYIHLHVCVHSPFQVMPYAWLYRVLSLSLHYQWSYLCSVMSVRFLISDNTSCLTFMPAAYSTSGLLLTCHVLYIVVWLITIIGVLFSFNRFLALSLQSYEVVGAE